MAENSPILKINNIEVRYHEVILVLKGVSVEVPAGGIVALLGANGAVRVRRSRPYQDFSTTRTARSLTEA